MRPVRPFRISILFLVAGLFLPTHGFAQSPVDPGQLPGRTSFYLLWRGTPSGDIRKSNSMYALWDDQDFAAARDSFTKSLLTESKEKKSGPAATPEELKQYATLLDNPFLVGYLRNPESAPAVKSPAGKGAPAPAWNGMFFIYDRTGKEELLSKAALHLRDAEKEIPKLTPMTLAGVAALKIERKSGVTYWAEFGKYAVSANEQIVFEEVVNTVNGKPATNPLSQSPSFLEAKSLLNGGVLEFFLSIGNAQQLAVDTPGSPAALIKPFLSALRLDTIHSLAGHISLEGAKTRLTGAILGDTSPGGLFDIWADGQANPVSFGYLSSDTVYYGESQLNFLGLYQVLKRAFTGSGTASSQQANPIETAAETRLGMPLPDALGITTGEIAHLQNSPTLDDGQKVYFLGIRNKPAALKLMRTLMGERITSERTEGDTTFLKVSLQGGQNASGVAQWNFYYLAMTPSLLLGASKSDTLHQYAAFTPAASDTVLPKKVLAVRGLFPEKLNGFSYFDFSKVDWPGLKARWVAEAAKSAQSAKSTEAADNTKKLSDWLSQVNPEVFSRHLHTMTGASWKDTKGVHFDQWVE